MSKGPEYVVQLMGRMVAVDLEKREVTFKCRVHEQTGREIAPYLMVGEVFEIATTDPIPALLTGSATK